MDPIVAAAEQILHQDPAPGLPLAQLTDHLRRRLENRHLDHATVRSRLEGAPDRFRVLDLHPGALAGLVHIAALGPSSAWVAALGQPETSPPSGPGRTGVTHLMRESVRAMAERVDDRSSRDVARWRRLLFAEADTRALLDAAS